MFRLFEKTFKLPRKVVTVDDVLSSLEVNKLLEEVVKNKSKIKDLIIIYKDSEDNVIWNNTCMNQSEMVGLLEQVKMWTVIDE